MGLEIKPPFAYGTRVPALWTAQPELVLQSVPVRPVTAAVTEGENVLTVETEDPLDTVLLLPQSADSVSVAPYSQSWISSGL